MVTSQQIIFAAMGWENPISNIADSTIDDFFQNVHWEPIHSLVINYLYGLIQFSTQYWNE